jgi:hypothetical protein
MGMTRTMPGFEADAGASILLTDKHWKGAAEEAKTVFCKKTIDMATCIPSFKVPTFSKYRVPTFSKFVSRTC